MNRRDVLKAAAIAFGYTGITALATTASADIPKDGLLEAGYKFSGTFNLTGYHVMDGDDWRIYRRRVINNKPVTILDEKLEPYETIGSCYLTETVIVRIRDGKIGVWPDTVSSQRIYCRNLKTNEVRWINNIIN